MVEKSVAPWSVVEVESLNGFQVCGAWHPFTCECGGVLVACVKGWTCPDCGGGSTRMIVQDWAHGFMVDGGWRDNPLIELLKGGE